MVTTVTSGVPQGGVRLAPVMADGPSTVVPDAQLLFTAEYSRVGDDLLLTGADGTTLVITGYFALEAPPVLFSPAGAMMSPALVAKLVGPLAPGQVAQAGPFEGAQAIGQVENVIGSAAATRDGALVQLNPGDPVYQNDVVQTGLASELVIGFADGTIFSLSANARMTLDEMVYDPDGSDNSLVMSVVHGTFSFITGQIAPSGEMLVETPVATIGIRGTIGHCAFETIAGPLSCTASRTAGGTGADVTYEDPLTGAVLANLFDPNSVYEMASFGAPVLQRLPTTQEQQQFAQRGQELRDTQSTFEFQFGVGEPIFLPQEGQRTEGDSPVVAQAGPGLLSGGIGIEQEFEDALAQEQQILGQDEAGPLPLLGGTEPPGLPPLVNVNPPPPPPPPPPANTAPTDFNLAVTATFVEEPPFDLAPDLGGTGTGTVPGGAPGGFTAYDGSDAKVFFADFLLGGSPGGLQILDVTYTGSNTAASHFSSVNFGSIGGIQFGLGSGLLLTSGDGTPALSNTSTGSSTTSAGGSDPDLVALAGSANDSSVVEITFTVPTGTTAISLDFMFGSEEFPEFIDSFPDIAGVFVDGVNYAYFNGDPGQLLNINTASVGNFYATGSGQDPGQAGAGALNIEYDGISRPLRLCAQLGAGTDNGDGTETHTLKIAAADTGDTLLDSGILVSNLRVSDGGSPGGIGDITSDLGPGFVYEFQVGTQAITPADNIRGTDAEDGLTTQFTITGLPRDGAGNDVGLLLIDRGDDGVVDEIVGPGHGPVPVDVQSGDAVIYLLARDSFTTTPDSVSFTYLTTDSGGLPSDGATVTIDFGNVPPTADSTAVTVDEDSQDNALGLDAPVDPDGDPLTVTVTSLPDPAKGTVTLDGGEPVSVGQTLSAAELQGLEFDAAPDANGPAGQFSYSVSDGTATDSGTVDIDITPLNDPPSDLTLPNASVAEDAAVGTVVGTVLVDDPDLGDTHTFALIDGAEGSFAIDPDTGVVTVDGALDFETASQHEIQVRATDAAGLSVERTLTIDVTDVNEPPLAQDDAIETDEDTPVEGNVLTGSGADSDPEDDALTVNTVPVVDVANGTLTLNADGSFTCTPDADFNGQDSFTYEVSDGNGGTDTATATITVNPVNDPPIVDLNGDGEGTGSATTFTEGDPAVAIASQGLVFDIDSPTLTEVTVRIANVQDPLAEQLTAELSGVSGTVFADGRLILTGPASLADFQQTLRTVTYVNNSENPAPGPRTIEVVADDGAEGNNLSPVAIATVDVVPVNDPPLAQDDVFETNEDTPIEGSVLADNGNGADSDPDGDNLSVALVSGPSNGGLNLAADGSFTYTPNLNFFGSDSFAYTIEDPDGETSGATVDIAVGAVDDGPPVAVDDFGIRTDEDTPVTISVLSNDTDPDGQGLTIIGTGVRPENTANGTAAINADGTITFTPNLNFVGTASFTYTIEDIDGQTDIADVQVTVDPVNDPPNDLTLPEAAVAEDAAIGTVVGTVLVEDPDPGDTHTFALIDGGEPPFAIDPDTGVLTVNGALDFETASQYQIQVRATDAAGLSVERTLTIDVTDVDEPPLAQDVFAIHDETPGVDPISDDTGDSLPGAIAALAGGLTLVNASKKAIPFTFGDGGPGGIALDDVTNGSDSGLDDTETGQDILLYNGPEGTVLGRVGSVEGPIAFIAYIEQTGTPTGPVEPAADLWLAQYRAIQHDNPLDPDEAGPETGPEVGAPTILDPTASAADLVIQGHGLDMAVGGAGLENEARSGTITVDVGGSLVSATLYWVGRDFASAPPGGEPVIPVPPAGADDELLFDGTLVTADRGTGSEINIARDGTPTNNIGYAADVTSIVAAAGAGTLSFSVADGDPGDDLDVLDGAGLLVIYSDPGDTSLQTVMVFEGLDFAFGDPGVTPTAATVTEPVIFSYGAEDFDRAAEVAVLVGDAQGAEEARPDRIDIDGTSFLNGFDADDGAAFDADVFDIAIPAGSTETTVQLFSETNADLTGSPDSLLWAVTALRTEMSAPTDENLALDYTVTNATGGEAGGTATVTMEDDGPMAAAEPVVFVDAGSGSIGSSTGAVDLPVNDVFGVDGAGEAGPVSLFSYMGDDGFGDPTTLTLPAGATASETFIGGELSVNPDGTWVYQPPDEVTGSTGELFSYTIRDGDGDTSAVSNEIVVLDVDVEAGEGLLLTGISDSADVFSFGPGDAAPTLAAADMISGFEDGLDMIGLVGGIDVGDVKVGSDGAGNAVIATTGNEILATLLGVDPAAINGDDFSTVVSG